MNALTAFLTATFSAEEFRIDMNIDIIPSDNGAL